MLYHSVSRTLLLVFNQPILSYLLVHAVHACLWLIRLKGQDQTPTMSLSEVGKRDTQKGRDSESIGVAGDLTLCRCEASAIEGQCARELPDLSHLFSDE